MPTPPHQQQGSSSSRPAWAKGAGCFRDTAPAPPRLVHHFAHIYNFARKDSNINPSLNPTIIKPCCCLLIVPSPLPSPCCSTPPSAQGRTHFGPALPRLCSSRQRRGHEAGLFLPHPRCRADASRGAAALWHGRRDHLGPATRTAAALPWVRGHKSGGANLNDSGKAPNCSCSGCLKTSVCAL